jgi:AraC-like DNA-binding protein/ligand-binding sensor protein
MIISTRIRNRIMQLAEGFQGETLRLECQQRGFGKLPARRVELCAEKAHEATVQFAGELFVGFADSLQSPDQDALRVDGFERHGAELPALRRFVVWAGQHLTGTHRRYLGRRLTGEFHFESKVSAVEKMHSRRAVSGSKHVIAGADHGMHGAAFHGLQPFGFQPAEKGVELGVGHVSNLGLHTRPLTSPVAQQCPIFVSPIIPKTERTRDMTTQMKSNKELVNRLSRSQIFLDYEQAFNDTTGLPLSIRPRDVWNLVQSGRRNENPFCKLMAETSKTCSACLQVQEELVACEDGTPRTVTCFAGLCDTAVPVRMGGDVVGYLQTGQVGTENPSEEKFGKISKQLIDWGLKVDLKEAQEAYFQSKVLSGDQYDSVVRLLTIFAQHLSLLCNQLMIHEENVEPPMIARAKQFIGDHQDEDISLTDVAKSVNASTFYFCKMFKKASGINFTEYLSRVRVEKAKNLLLNPNARVSEVAYNVGFQSLTHFNRVFRKLTGYSPTEYRRRTPV